MLKKRWDCGAACDLCGLTVGALCSPLVTIRTLEDGNFAGPSFGVDDDWSDLVPLENGTLEGRGQAEEGKQLVHECCVRWLKRFREGARNRGIARADRDVVTTASLSGRSRTRPIGIDQHGHTYWLFAAAPGSVFVQLGHDPSVDMELDGPPSDLSGADDPVSGTGWVRYDESMDLSRLMKVRLCQRGVEHHRPTSPHITPLVQNARRRFTTPPSHLTISPPRPLHHPTSI